MIVGSGFNVSQSMIQIRVGRKAYRKGRIPNCPRKVEAVELRLLPSFKVHTRVERGGHLGWDLGSISSLDDDGIQ
jgi:hypothetical protein